MADRAYLERLSKEMIDSGKLIEAGWIGMRLACVPLDAPKEQLHEMRLAFFAGAQHLFGTIMNVLDPGDEPTEQDLRRMDLVDQELRGFIKEFELRHIPTKGQA